LVACLCRELSGTLELGVVTNDIYTDEDARFLRSEGVLPAQRITAVQTGCCPHTAIRDDISANLDAVIQLEQDHGPLDLVFVESGGDNLTAAFSPALADTQIFVLDCAGGDDVPRKGGPGITRSDMLVINKTDLAPLVGASVQTMLDDAAAKRSGRPVLALSLRDDGSVPALVRWLGEQLASWRAGTLVAAAEDLSSPPAAHRHTH
jgi:urease accessory protein